jgi:DNA-binding response OmpR family regulator
MLHIYVVSRRDTAIDHLISAPDQVLSVSIVDPAEACAWLQSNRFQNGGISGRMRMANEHQRHRSREAGGSSTRSSTGEKLFSSVGLLIDGGIDNFPVIVSMARQRMTPSIPIVALSDMQGQQGAIALMSGADFAVSPPLTPLALQGLMVAFARRTHHSYAPSVNRHGHSRYVEQTETRYSPTGDASNDSDFPETRKVTSSPYPSTAGAQRVFKSHPHSLGRYTFSIRKNGPDRHSDSEDTSLEHPWGIKPEDMPSTDTVSLNLSSPSPSPAASDASAEYPEEDVVLDVEERTICINGSKKSLTERPALVMEYLGRHQGQCCTRDELLEDVWGLDFDPATNVVDVQIYTLRKIFRKEGKQDAIQTVRGRGYRLTEAIHLK